MKLGGTQSAPADAADVEVDGVDIDLRVEEGGCVLCIDALEVDVLTSPFKMVAMLKSAPELILEVGLADRVGDGWARG